MTLNQPRTPREQIFTLDREVSDLKVKVERLEHDFDKLAKLMENYMEQLTLASKIELAKNMEMKVYEETLTRLLVKKLEEMKQL